MIKKMTKKFIAIILLILLVTTGLAACKPEKTNKVSKIEIIKGSFKEQYALDEPLNLKNAKIKVFYVDGETNEIPITKEMVTGFDTRTNYPQQKTLEVTYKTITTTFNYKVGGETGVTSIVRFVIEEETDVNDENEYCFIKLYALYANEVKDGIYAFMFDIEKAEEISIEKSDAMSAQSFSTKYWTTTAYENEENSNKISIIAYSKNGSNSLTSVIPENESKQKILLYSLRIKRHTSPTTVELKNIYLSDGNKDTKAPSVRFAISCTGSGTE